MNVKACLLRLSLLFCALPISCRHTGTDAMLVNGHLKELPDGTMYLTNSQNKRVDSCQVQNGKFTFTISRKQYPEAAFFSLEHVDKKSVRYVFAFPTHRKFLGDGLMAQYFMMEEDANVSINGTLKDFGPRNIKLPPNIKLVYVDSVVSAGRQNTVYDNVDFLIGDNITDSAYKDALLQVEHYPYSYYLLDQINHRLTSLSNTKARSLFNHFDLTRQQSTLGRQIASRLSARSNNKLSEHTLLENQAGQQIAAVDTTQKLNIVVLWASWCHPCRMEIPELKKAYAETLHQPGVRLVSVSVDRDHAAWLKAVKEENMPWEQLVMPSTLQATYLEVFSFEGYIPTTLITDSHGKILQHFTGFENDYMAKYKTFVTDYLQQHP